MSYKIEKLKPILENAINNSLSMKEAASKINMNHNTFTKYAKKLGIYKTNQNGKGIKKKMPLISLEFILSGNYPHYHTCKLGKRLIKENYKEHKCEVCNLSDWNSLPIPLELHHIDGNSNNHLLINLQLICPNCHSQTDNFRSKNKKSSR